MADTPPLVWSNGQPMRAATRSELATEIAGPTLAGVRSVYAGHPAQGLTPQRLASLLRGAEQGDMIRYLELAEEMEEKDLHYLSVLGTRKRQVSQLPIEVVPASDSADDKADADLVRAWLDRDLLEAELFDVLDAVGKGFSVCELVWDTSVQPWLPVKLTWRDPSWFEFDPVDMETLTLRESAGRVPLPLHKFIVHRHPAKSGLTIRSGLARAVAWGWMFKNYAIKDWVTFLESYGMPMRVGRYDNGETEANRRVLLDALRNLGTDQAAMFPKTMEVEFINSSAGAAPNDLWRAKAEFVDLQVSKAVLGQTNTTEAQSGGLGSGQANVHNEVRADIERADAKLLAATLNEQLVKPIVMLNRGQRARYPKLKIGRPEPVDVKALTDAVRVLVPMGVDVDVETVRERAGLPAPKPGAALLHAATQAAPQGSPQSGLDMPGGSSTGSRPSTGLLDPLKSTRAAIRPQEVQAAASQADDQADAIAQATDEALGDWEKLVAPIIAPIEAAAAAATSLEDLRDRLIGTIETMDATALTELLARGLFGARLAGDVAARPVEDA